MPREERFRGAGEPHACFREAPLNKVLALGAVLAFGATSAASATIGSSDFLLRYTLEDETVFAVTLTGDVQDDLETIYVTAISQVVYDGLVRPAVGFIESALDLFNDEDSRRPTVTISDDEMDLVACEATTCDRGFAFSPEFGEINENFDPARYSLTLAPVPIPLPAASALLGSALGLLAFRSRRSQRAARQSEIALERLERPRTARGFRG